MSTTKRFSSMRVFAILLVLTLVLSCSMFATMAKYSSAVSVSDTANIAAWSFKVNDVEIATNSAQTLDIALFDTVYDIDGSAEDDVTAGLLAPGTSGAFAVKVENTSDVNAEYALTLTVDNSADIPLEFSTDNGKTWVSDLDDLSAADDIAIDETATIKVMWRWAFDGDDTSIGIAAQGGDLNVKVTATLTATQVD